MSTTATPSAPNDPPPPPPGPPGPPKGKFRKLCQNIRVASRSLRTSSKFTGKVVDLAKTLTELAAEAVDDAGVPGLAVGIGILDEVLGKVQTMSDNIKDADSLKERIEKLKADMATFDSLPPGQALPEGMQQGIAGLVKTWATIGQNAQRIAHRGRFKRFMTSRADADELEDLVGQIKTSIDDFLLHEALVLGRNVHQVHQIVTTMAAILEESFMPMYAKRAQYNASSVRRPCLPNTRVAILHMVRAWILATSTQDAVPNIQDGIVYLIDGLAGTGKTAIAYSIAVWCKEQGILGASFFCSRQDAECRNPNLIFITICRQLCQFHAPFKAEVAKVLQEDPSVIQSSPTEQFERLILKPLEALKDALPKTVIVIDALDECEDEEATSTSLNVLAKFMPRIIQILHRPLVFIVTSCPERRVTALLDQSREESLNRTTTRLSLHKLAPDTIRNDIRHCIQHEFKMAAGVLKVKKDWPSKWDMDELARLSGRLFIFATTAVKFIMSPNAAGVPEERMHAILHPGPASPLPEDLKSLYLQIAKSAFKSHPDFQSRSNSLRPVLGTIALAREPLSSKSLSKILRRNTDDVLNTLSGLHSVLHIPEDNSEAIEVIHPTFVEFLLAMDPELVKPGEFRINASDQHILIFERSLQIMLKELKRNIAGFPSHLLSKDEVPTLTTNVQQCIPPHLSYVTLHWAVHLDGAANNSTFAGSYDLFHKFLHQRLLHWLEASSLLGALEGAVMSLNTARMACVKIGNTFTTFVSLLADCHRFAMAYHTRIDTSPLQLYQAALSFAPHRSLVKQVYRKELRGAPIVQRGAALDWEPCIKTFKSSVGLDHGATCIAFSPDRSHYVDRRSRILSMTTQKVLTTLEPQTNGISCAAFCPDGQHVALVSEERSKTLDVWHLTSGEQVRSFEGHRNDIHFITYSADGRCILSADDGEVRLWGVSDGQPLLMLPWDLDLPWGIALSPDGAVIALPGSAENCLCLYFTVSQTNERLSLPGKMRTVAFSLNGRCIASGTDTKIIISTLANGSPSYSLDIPSQPLRLAFSADSTRLGAGLGDGSVYLWQIGSPGPPVILGGHAGPVANVVWSPDDSQIISVSYDHTVRIWDAARSFIADEQPEPLTDTIPLPNSPRPTVLCKLENSYHIFHLPGPTLVESVYTPDDAPTMTLHANVAEAWDAALSTDSSYRPRTDMLSLARNWELLTGQRHISTTYSPVTLSQDATFMAYAPSSIDNTIRVCDLRTGAVAASLSCDRTVYSTTFSPDGSLLATGSRAAQVCVWNISTQQLVASHTTHSGHVFAVAFSHNGQQLASGGDDGVVCLYDSMHTQTVRKLTFSPHSPWVMRVAFSADDAHVIALDERRHAWIGDTESGAIIHRFSLHTDDWTRSLDFTPNCTALLVHAEDGRVHKIVMSQTEHCLWPVYRVLGDGWVTERSRGRRARRVCWLPPEWRLAGVFSLGGSMFCAVDWGRKRSVVVDVSEVEGWPPMTAMDFTS